MEQLPLATFAQMLAELREEIAAADPQAQAAPSEDTPIPPASSAASSAPEPEPSAAELAAQADTFSATFDQAPDAARQEYLLHALDEAIVAIEMASLLAEEHHTLALAEKMTAATTTSSTNTGPLYEAYQAFTESQPAYQALYHYRNALATQLQKDAIEVPPAVAAEVEMPQENEPAH